MRIYDIEKLDKLENKLEKASIRILAKVNSLSQEQEFILKYLKQDNSTDASVESVKDLIGIDQPDLSLIVSILVSAGWNLNDDVFAKEELWKAKLTPIHKPMNDEHDESIILGHIVASRALDKNGNEIGDNDNIPDDFDIEVAGVLYKSLPKIKDRIEQIIDKANKGEMFVSMECWFDDFAYAFKDQNNKVKIVARDEKTAFLTKYLRVYGGAGEYQGYKIGRVLKNIVFGGQGFVESPANPESVIKIAANLNKDLEGGVENMNDADKKLEAALADLESKNAEITKLTKELNETKAQLDIWKTKVAEVDQAIQKSLSEGKQAFEKLEAEKSNIQKLLDDMTKRAESAEKDLAEIRKSELARTRFDQLSKLVNVEDKDATMAELGSMSDDTFNTIIKYSKNTKAEEIEKEGEKEEISAEASLDTVEKNTKDDVNLQPGNDNEDDDINKLALATAKRLLGREEKETD